jgi:hypothetical protein
MEMVRQMQTQLDLTWGVVLCLELEPALKSELAVCR